MTEVEYIEHLRLASSMLSKKDITLEEFEEHCIAAAVCFRGPPPEGRRYVVGLAGNRLVVGHVDLEEPVGKGLRFLSGKSVD